MACESVFLMVRGCGMCHYWVCDKGITVHVYVVWAPGGT